MNQRSGSMHQVRKKATVLPISTGEALGDLAQEVHRSVARRAYEFYQARGHEDGHHLADWLHAEAEMMRPLKEQVSESREEVRVEASVAGFTPADLQIGVDSSRLIVAGKRRSEANLNAHPGDGRIEMLSVISLPCEIDPSHAQASLEDQLLTVVLPKATSK